MIDEDDKLPRISTLQIDLVAYEKQRDFFLNTLAKFKAGEVSEGIKACGFLQSMYFILPATRHTIQDRTAATKFVDDIDKLRREIVIYQRRANNLPKGSSFLECDDYEETLGNPMDELVRRFHEIMHSTGFTN